MRERIEQALTVVRQTLEADGFALHIAELTPARLHLRVEPTGFACFDCLPPRDLLETMIRQALREQVPESPPMELEVLV